MNTTFFGYHQKVVRLCENFVIFSYFCELHIWYMNLEKLVYPSELMKLRSFLFSIVSRPGNTFVNITIYFIQIHIQYIQVAHTNLVVNVVPIQHHIYSYVNSWCFCWGIQDINNAQTNVYCELLGILNQSFCVFTLKTRLFLSLVFA